MYTLISFSSISSRISSIIPTPRYLDRPVAGLDISSEAIRIVELVHTSKGYMPRRYDTRKLSMQLGNERLVDHAELVQTLRDMVRTNKLSAVRVALPEEKTYIFTTELSREAFKDARTAVGFKIEENVPVNPATAVYDYVTLKDDPSSDTVTVVVTVVSEDVIAGYLELLSLVGLTVVGFLPQSQAIARAGVPDAECGPVLLVHAHDDDTDISLVDNHAVQYSSTSYSTGPDVVDRIQKVLTFWQSRIRTHGAGSMPAQLLVAGSHTEDGDLKKALLASVSLPVQRINVWKNCFSFDSYVPPIPRNESFAYGVAIGCALPDRHNCI